MLDYKDIIIKHYALHMSGRQIAAAIGASKSRVYYGKNVPLFRRNGYRKPGAMIP